MQKNKNKNKTKSNKNKEAKQNKRQPCDIPKFGTFSQILNFHLFGSKIAIFRPDVVYDIIRTPLADCNDFVNYG